MQLGLLWLTATQGQHPRLVCCSGMSTMSASSEAPLTRAFSGGPALERNFTRHSSVEASRMAPRPPVPQSAGLRRASPVAIAARIAASSEHLLGEFPSDAPDVCCVAVPGLAPSCKFMS